MKAPTSRVFAARKTARAASYVSMRRLMAGVVNPPASPRPIATYSSWMEAGRMPRAAAAFRMESRASSRRAASASKTALLTRASIAPFRKPAGSRFNSARTFSTDMEASRCRAILFGKRTAQERQHVGEIPFAQPGLSSALVVFARSVYDRGRGGPAAEVRALRSRALRRAARRRGRHRGEVEPDLSRGEAGDEAVFPVRHGLERRGVGEHRANNVRCGRGLPRGRGDRGAFDRAGAFGVSVPDRQGKAGRENPAGHGSSHRAEAEEGDACHGRILRSPAMERRELSASEIAALAEIVGAPHLLVAKDDLQPYAHDWTEDFVHYPAAAAKPKTTDEVSRLLAFCNERRIPVTPQGGRTGLSGGALPLAGGVALSLERMNAILEIDTDNFVAIAEAGVVTQTLHEAVEAVGLYYPPDPASRGSCMIGGNIAENAGGPHAAKYGVTGRWVMGVEAVFADGGVAVTGGKTRKDVAGYDLTSLLLGSEGTLGIVTKAWLRLIPKPPYWATLVAPFPTLEDAARCMLELHRRGLVLSACEFVDKPSIDLSSKKKGVGVPFPEAEARLLLEFDGPSEAEVERDVTLAGEIALECRALDVVLATDEAKRRVLWDCLLYTSDAADAEDSVDLGGRRTIKKHKKKKTKKDDNEK